MKKALICLSITAIMAICMSNSVAAAPVSKLTTNVHDARTTYVRSDGPIKIMINSILNK